MYQCAIAYTGNSDAGQQAEFQSITINGELFSNAAYLGNFSTIWGYVLDSLTSLSITSSVITVSSNNEGTSPSIANNTGANIVWITIFYPIAELTASVDVLINGVTETFNFEKIATV